MRPKQTIGDRGFTMTELMVVMVVIGLIAAMAVPGVSKFNRSSKFVGAVNTLVADVHEARSLASAKRKTFQINFTSAGYTILQTAPVDTLRTRKYPKNVTCTATGSATFFPWGLTTPTNITVTNGYSSRVIRVIANGSVLGV